MATWRDQVALVTGGARGIGRATSLLLAKYGAAVCVNYAAHAEAPVNALKCEIRRLPPDGMGCVHIIRGFPRVKVCRAHPWHTRRDDENMATWRDQVALVTGGARGIGQATARLLAKCGAAVCVNYAARARRPKKKHGGGSQQVIVVGGLG